MEHRDVVIAGAGVVGLSLALELRLRGREVCVIDRGTPGLASRAAAGMLAAHDPHNPPALQPLADLALTRYPTYLHTVRALSGHPVVIQTKHVLEPDPLGQPGPGLLPALAADAGSFTVRAEQSLNPRDLHAALQVAASHAGVRFQHVSSSQEPPADFLKTFSQSVDCTGAWSPLHTDPVKGQMLRVRLPDGSLQLAGNRLAVLRTSDIYLVPRLDGTTLIGASVEDAGFDLRVQDEVLSGLRARAATLLPAAATAPEVERWAGLRPRTRDELPVLGRISETHYVANGLFRNGILLAPAVAHIVAQMLLGEPTDVPADAFSPGRASLHDSR